MAKLDRDNRTLLQSLDLLEGKVSMTNNEYEMYFMGVVKRAPDDKLREITRELHEYTELNITNGRVLFKLRVLRARFNTLSLRWLRTMKQIEDGTYTKHRWLADKRDAERAKAGPKKTSDEVRAEIKALARGEDPEAAARAVRQEKGLPEPGAGKAAPSVTPPRGPAPAPARKDTHALGSDGLFDAYMTARRDSGEHAAVNRVALESTLRKHVEQIKQKYGARDVQFKVVQEDGKAKVKAIPLK